jgi:hypothetical protein
MINGRAFRNPYARRSRTLGRAQASCRVLNGADDIMSFNEKSKRLYVAGKAFVSRHFVATLVVIVILLQAIIWLAVRALEDNQNFYRCGDHDYPCGVNIQPEPKI